LVIDFISGGNMKKLYIISALCCAVVSCGAFAMEEEGGRRITRAEFKRELKRECDKIRNGKRDAETDHFISFCFGENKQRYVMQMAIEIAHAEESGSKRHRSSKR